MQVEWQDGLVKHLQSGAIEGVDWGAETADRAGFFSLTDPARGCRVEDIRPPVGEGDSGSRAVEVQMPEGHWTLDIDTQVRASTVVVTQQLHCLAPSVLQDFVMRFRFTQDSFESGEINGERVTHRGSNIWHQHPTDEVTLSGPGGRLRIWVMSAETAEKFTQVMYIRDEPGFWIVHARLLPKEPCDLYATRWPNRWFTLAINDIWSRRLLAWPWLKRTLWYSSERRGGRPQLQAIGLSRLAPSETLALSVRVEFEQRR